VPEQPENRRHETVDIRTLELATTALVKIESHEVVCTQRYMEIRDTFSDLRSEVRSSVGGLNASIREAIKTEGIRWFKIGILVLGILIAAIGGLLGFIMTRVIP